jgi:hypothetical protein
MTRGYTARARSVSLAAPAALGETRSVLERTGFCRAIAALFPLALATGCKSTPPALDASRVQAAPAGANAPAPSNGVPPNGPANAPPPSATPVGTIVPDLAGKWCFMANIDAKDGGRETGTCFTLKDDGTYQLRTDGSAPAPFTGSAPPPSSEVGHWAATTNALSVVAASGQSARYPLAKKNHPKTRDPMLVLSGQPFVTVFQKPPW